MVLVKEAKELQERQLRGEGGLVGGWLDVVERREGRRIRRYI